MRARLSYKSEVGVLLLVCLPLHKLHTLATLPALGKHVRKSMADVMCPDCAAPCSFTWSAFQIHPPRRAKTQQTAKLPNPIQLTSMPKLQRRSRKHPQLQRHKQYTLIATTSRQTSIAMLRPTESVLHKVYFSEPGA